MEKSRKSVVAFVFVGVLLAGQLATAGEQPATGAPSSPTPAEKSDAPNPSQLPDQEVEEESWFDWLLAQMFGDRIGGCGSRTCHGTARH